MIKTTKAKINATAEKILSTANTVLVDKCFNAPSLSQLAEPANIKQELIFHDFKSQACLWEAYKKNFFKTKDIKTPNAHDHARTPGLVYNLLLVDYWSAVITEVDNLGKPGATTYFIPSSKRTLAISDRDKPARKTQRYALGKPFGETYFSAREAECMLLLIKGKTLAQTAKDLKLSTRTVEFYVNNMKKKIHCKKKKILIEKVLGSDFLHNLQLSSD
jgi:DNA-binding CsgD family transcriptional regulator